MTGREATSTRIRAILDALERDDNATALQLLGSAEWEAFDASNPDAGEYGYARWAVATGQTATAVSTLRRLLERRR